MVFIEFFEKYSVENLCASLASCPEKVILIGSNLKQMNKHKARYEKIFELREKNIEFICRSVNRNDLASIVHAIEDIIKTTDDIYFGLTGGDDLYLVAMGIIAERYKDKNIQMHRFNIKNNKIFDCDGDGNMIEKTEVPCLSVWEYVYSHGGDIITDPENEYCTFEWDFDAAFSADVHGMWEICKTDTRGWNIQTTIFGIVDKLCDSENTNSLKIEASMQDVINEVHRSGNQYGYYSKIVKALYRDGYITAYEYNDNKISVTFRDSQIKRCLTKAGQVLELKIYIEAKFAKDDNGNYVYYDAMNGVYIDWDGVLGDKQDMPDTINEVDVILTHDMIPVFISCKNGWVSMEELYKLSTVAQRFGGEYAKKVLVAPSLEKFGDHAKYVRKRANDMGIIVEDDIESMDDEKMRSTIATWWERPL